MSKGTLRLTEKDIPNIKNWKVNETYKIEVIVKLKDLASEPDYSDVGPVNITEQTPVRKPKEIISGRFEIQKAYESDKKDVSKATRKEFEGMLAKAYQGKSINEM